MKGVAFLSGLFCVLSGPTDGCTTWLLFFFILLFCTIKILRSVNFGVNDQETLLRALASTVPLVRVSSLYSSMSVVWTNIH